VNISPAVIFEDPHCLAVIKPAGQFTQGTWAPEGEITLETAVRTYLDPSNPAAVYLGIVHRLDRPTSGVLIWAKTPKAARRLSSQFERRIAIKEYWAIVESHAGAAANEDREQVWSDWLTRADARGVVQCVPAGHRGAREAVTEVRFESAAVIPSGFHWLRLWPKTGRTHQLRVQATRRGWPILGDALYGAAPRSTMVEKIALHARSLQIHHPVTGSLMTLVAPVPEWWREDGIHVGE
jgi:23S rRNA pseudouridine1911/1915/1917 synthase